MLISRLQRVQVELQGHRLWLRAFTTRSVGQSGPIAGKLQAAPSTYVPIRRNVHISRTKQRRPSSTGRKPGRVEQHIEIIVSLRDALKRQDIDLAAQLYRAALDKLMLDEDTVRALVQGLHYRFRLERQNATQDRDLIARLQAFAQEIVADIRKGALQPSPTANAHLLGFFRDTQSWDASLKFWKWLEVQEDDQLNPAVYSAAIEILALQNGTLTELEALYQQALARFPEGFASYHFMPGAIVPDREQDSQIPRLPMNLLHAILTARLLRGDSHNAYLALDTGLRLIPNSLSSTFFTGFMEERPVTEAYAVFALACRAGIQTSRNQYRALLVRLRTDLDTRDTQHMILALRAMLSCTYLFIGAGGKITRNTVSEILITISSILRLKEVNNLSVEQKRQLADVVQGTITQALELFSRFGVTPSMPAFNSIITNIGGYGHSREAIEIGLRNAQTLGLAPTIVTQRSILTAAGILTDVHLIRDAWKALVEDRATMDQYPDATDLHILIKACKSAGEPDMARAVVNEMDHLEDFQIENALIWLDQVNERTPSPDQQPADVNVLIEEVEKINADLAAFQQLVGDNYNQDAQDLSSQRLPMALFPPSKDVQLPEAEMKKLYDELTTDPSAANSAARPAESGPAVSKTNIALGSLRYENWRSLTFLMSEAEKHDQIYYEAVDKAIASGARPPPRNKGLVLEAGNVMTRAGLSDIVQEGEKAGDEDVEAIDVEGNRRRILELRKA